jgi:hypothetical protein
MLVSVAPVATAEMFADRSSGAFLARPTPYAPSLIQWLSCRPSNEPTQLMTQKEMTNIMALSLPLPQCRCRAIY